MCDDAGRPVRGHSDLTHSHSVAKCASDQLVGERKESCSCEGILTMLCGEDAAYLSLKSLLLGSKLNI